MSEYRNRTTGEVKSKFDWIRSFPNTSLPSIWKQATLDALDLDPVIRGPNAATSAYQISVRDGVVQDANGSWVENYVARDMFADDAELGTKAEQEAAYQAALDAGVAEANRTKRNKLLADSDWTQMNDSPLSNEDKTAWATYRQELRDISDLASWPNLEEADWPVAP